MVFGPCLDCCWPLLEVLDDSPVELSEGRFFMWLDILVFAIIPVLPLRPHQGMKLRKYAFDPLPAGFL